MLDRSNLAMPWAAALVLASILIAVGAADATTRGSGFASIYSPSSTNGPWHWAWLVAVSASFVFYAVGVFRLRRRSGALVPVMTVAVAIQLAPLLGPLLLSSDAYGYWDYGRVEAVHHANPYSDAPSEFPEDPAFRIVGQGLGSTTTIYGPAFTAFSAVHARVAGNSPKRAAFLYRLTSALGVIALLLVSAKAVAARRAFAVAFIGWNPLLAFHFAGGGHNDVWMLLFALGGVVLVRRGSAVLGGAAWALSAAVKTPALAFVPLELVAVLRRGRHAKLARRFAFGFLVASALAAAGATALYGTAWVSEFGRATSHAQETSSLSSVFRLGKFGVPAKPAERVLELLLVVGYLRLAWDAWRGRARLGLAASLLILTPAWLVPWYGSWAVVFTAVEDDFAAQIVAVAATAYLLSDAVPLPFTLPFSLG